MNTDYLKATTIEGGLLLNFGREQNSKDLYMIIKEKYQRPSVAEQLRILL